jgi:hypothetical protein
MAEHEAVLPPGVRRGWLRNLALGLVLLLCGAAIGSVVTAVVVERGPFHGMKRPEHLSELIAHRIKTKYGLNDEQEQKLRGIFEEHGKKLADIRADVQPRVEAEHEALQKAVETVLTPEQASDWEKEFEQMRRAWHFRGGDAPGSRDNR